MEGAAVGIFNLGRARDWSNATFNTIFKGLFKVEGAPPQAAGQSFGVTFADGDVSFLGNQCLLDLGEPGLASYISSIVIMSLDDIAFQNNQCEFHPYDSFINVGTVLYGFSVRAGGNRFKETASHVHFSIITLGVANNTCGNQSTHCVRALALQSTFLVQHDNTVLIDPLGIGFCSPYATFPFGKT